MSIVHKFNWKDKLILVVDDDYASLLLLEVIIAKTGAKIIEANSGKKAFEVFLNTRGIDLVLTDIKMEGMSGMELAQLIRKIDSNIPIIAQTACVIAGDKEKCLRAGCTDYISKPIITEDLLQIVDRYIGVCTDSSPVKKLFSEN